MAASESLGGVPESAWDRLAGPHFYSSSMWLGHCADGSPHPPAAVAARQGDRTVAVPVTPGYTPKQANYDWAATLAGRGLPGIPGTGTLVGPTQGYQTALLGDLTDAGLVAEALRRARDTLDPSSGDASCVAMFLDTEGARAAERAGVEAVPVLLEPDAWIEVPEGGWDAWIASFPSKRRISIRREVRAFEEAGFTVSHVPLGECWELLPDLTVPAAAKYGASTERERFVKAFSTYVRTTGDAARVALCRRDGEPVGFCIYYVWQDSVFLRWAAFDYARLAKAAEYFNVVYYSQIALARQLGVRRLHAGKKTLDAKVNRGARLRPLWLLDLSADSALAGHGELIRKHNADRLAAIEEDPALARAITDREEWTHFC
ncbi:GNAT family N-acetyltransferase [Streptomyces sp. NPDC046727]|uniref:GNAT family N-acetyltransferase n=1 Tax=Streptomyces sp. NPDC046727 TaxID=3155373 RepID=UPI0033E8F6A8